MKKILFFQLKTVCYDSYRYFSNSLARELQNAGFSIEIFDITKEPLEALNRYEGSSYDAIIDFNSDLPKLMMEDGSFFLDSIDAPFYDVVLDHPLYHHDMLKATLKDFHVICLDINHQNYIRENYPHIKSVDVLEMTGETSSAHVTTSFNEREIPLLFTGTYTPSNDILKAISHTPHFMQEYMADFIQQMKANPRLSLEDCVSKAANENDMIAEMFPLHMQSFFLVDSYIRSYEREIVLESIIKAHIPITLCGENWNRYLDEYLPSKDILNTEGVAILPSVSFEDSFELMSRSMITLNIMPHFLNGAHDRIYSATLNKSVCLTNTTPYLGNQFEDGVDYVCYDIRNLSMLPTLIDNLYSQPSSAEKIAKNGYKKALTEHTWTCRSKDLLPILNL